VSGRRGRIVTAVVLAAAVVFWAWTQRDDPRLPAAAAAAALQAEVGAETGFTCTRQEEDASLALDDVDYWCEAADGSTAYWIGTDEDGINGVQPAG
jgi:hypothetical protein